MDKHHPALLAVSVCVDGEVAMLPCFEPAFIEGQCYATAAKDGPIGSGPVVGAKGVGRAQFGVREGN